MNRDPKISVRLVDGEIEVPKYNILPSIGCGGECVFIGRTRPEHHAEHGQLVALKYDCYKAMAQGQLEKIAVEAAARFNIRAINISHSTGTVAVDGASVVIAVGSDHRDDAFLACRFLIDLLKLQVTIWKQEVWKDGTSWSLGTSVPIAEVQ